MALLVFPGSYNGTDRPGAISALVTHLKSVKPDVIGLSECFANGERDTIAEALKEFCPYRLDGPDEDDLESDGGLLLLSRHPFAASGQVIYRDCTGADCFANKGALWARIDVEGHPSGGYDIFLSHTQDPDAGSDAQINLDKQLVVLAKFIGERRDPKRPALLMGDLNTNGRNAALYKAFAARLGFSTDVGIAVDGSDSGITYDQHGSFTEVTPARAAGAPERHTNGQRLDYLLFWRGEHFVPSFAEVQVVVWQSSPGRDISDHYGLMARQAWLFELEAL